MREKICSASWPARQLSLGDVSERTGVDPRTIRGITSGAHRPHPRTLHRLAQGLGVSVDEFFLDPARLIYRRFDRQTNPLAAELIEEQGELFEGWRQCDFDELHSRVGAGGALTRAGAPGRRPLDEPQARDSRQARRSPGKHTRRRPSAASSI